MLSDSIFEAKQSLAEELEYYSKSGMYESWIIDEVKACITIMDSVLHKLDSPPSSLSNLGVNELMENVRAINLLLMHLTTPLTTNPEWINLPSPNKHDNKASKSKRK